MPLIIFGNTGPKAKYLLLSKLCLWPKTSHCLPQQWKHPQSNHWEVFLIPAGAWCPCVLAQRGAAQHAAPLAPWSTLLHKLRAWCRQRWGSLQQMRQMKEGVSHNPSCLCNSDFPPLPEIPVAWGSFKAISFSQDRSVSPFQEAGSFWLAAVSLRYGHTLLLSHRRTGFDKNLKLPLWVSHCVGHATSWPTTPNPRVTRLLSLQAVGESSAQGSRCRFDKPRPKTVFLLLLAKKRHYLTRSCFPFSIDLKNCTKKKKEILKNAGNQNSSR